MFLHNKTGLQRPAYLIEPFGSVHMCVADDYEQIERSLEASPSQVMAEVSGSGPGKVPDAKFDMVSLRTEARSAVKAARPSSDGSSMLFICGI